MSPLLSRPSARRRVGSARPVARRALLATGAFALAAGTAAFTPAVRAALVPGTTYTFRMTTAESDASFAAARKVLTQSVGKVQIAGDKARIDFAEVKGPSPTMGKEGYILLHDGGSTMFMVSPKEKQYIRMDAKQLGSMFSSLQSMTGGLMKIEVKDPSFSARKIGAGETILGYATEKWEIQQKYTMSIKTFGFGSTTTDETTSTIWFAPALKPSELMNPFLDMARNFGAMFEGNAEWQKLMEGPARELPQVAALKMEARSTSTSDKGQTNYSMSTMEVTEWSKGDVDASQLEVPSGFTMVEMPNIAALSDSLKAAGMDTVDFKAAMKQAGYKDEDIAEALKEAAKQGAMDQAKEEARNAGREAVKSGIRGLLRRRPPF
ncbi:MAG TPA: hypothetical protein PKE51_12170 [Gemmatimonadaceae bacterium]|nr:hypothetical protein [Gemmatimonadaceae bacterium]